MLVPVVLWTVFVLSLLAHMVWVGVAIVRSERRRRPAWRDAEPEKVPGAGPYRTPSPPAPGPRAETVEVELWEMHGRAYSKRPLVTAMPVPGPLARVTRLVTRLPADIE